MATGLKSVIKSYLPPRVWNYLRQFTYDSWLAGLFFTLFVRQWKLDGLRFEYPKHLVPLRQRALFLFGGYEEAERVASQRHINPDDSVLELGGCLGVVSCAINRLLSDRSRHLVVEANPYLLATLYRNRHINRARFRVLNAAAGEGSWLWFSPRANIHVSTAAAETSQPGDVDEFQIPAVSLSELTARFGSFSVLVADIEGAEFTLFSREPEALASFRMVILETHPEAYPPADPSGLEKILLSRNFQCVDRLGPVQVWKKRVKV